jgi:sugar lactone lactonase YvrE
MRLQSLTIKKTVRNFLKIGCLRRALIMAVFLPLAVGCATTPVAQEPVVWPEPPEKPHIRFVRAFRHAADLETSRWAHFKRTELHIGDEPALGQPMGVAVSHDGDRLYVADYGGGRVMLADFRRQTMDVFAPDAKVERPFNVALDAQENVYVSDSARKSVLVLDRRGSFLRRIGEGDLERPTGLALDAERKILYVADSSSKESPNHRVRVYGLDGTHLRDLGPSVGPPAKGDGDGQFHFPTYLALDSDGNVYVADTMNFRIQVFGPDGRFLRKYGESGETPGTFNRLKGLAFDSFDNLYAVDGGHGNVQIFNRDFAQLMFFGGFARLLEYFDVPSGIAIDRGKNRIYVCNTAVPRINVYDLINTTAGDANPGGLPLK